MATRCCVSRVVQPCLQTRLQEAGNQAAARIYGQDPHPEVQVVAMHPGTYQRTKHSRNFLAGHIATDMVLAEGDPQRWNRNPRDFSAEPIYARRNAVEALQCIAGPNSAADTRK